MRDHDEQAVREMSRSSEELLEENRRPRDRHDADGRRELDARESGHDREEQGADPERLEIARPLLVARRHGRDRERERGEERHERHEDDEHGDRDPEAQRHRAETGRKLAAARERREVREGEPEREDVQEGVEERDDEDGAELPRRDLDAGRRREEERLESAALLLAGSEVEGRIEGSHERAHDEYEREEPAEDRPARSHVLERGLERLQERRGEPALLEPPVDETAAPVVQRLVDVRARRHGGVETAVEDDVEAHDGRRVALLGRRQDRREVRGRVEDRLDAPLGELAPLRGVVEGRGLRPQDQVVALVVELVPEPPGLLLEVADPDEARPLLERPHLDHARVGEADRHDRVEEERHDDHDEDRAPVARQVEELLPEDGRDVPEVHA